MQVETAKRAAGGLQGPMGLPGPVVAPSLMLAGCRERAPPCWASPPPLVQRSRLSGQLARPAISADLSGSVPLPAYGVAANGAFLPGVGPPRWGFPSPSYSLRCKAEAAAAAQTDKNMTANTKRNGSIPSRERRASKPMQVATASVALPPPANLQNADPSQAAIAEKAYAIWLSLGRVLGHDQANWFEAERQLRLA